MESVGRLASGVAHDFNNLLTVIIGRSYLLHSRMDHDERTRRDLDLIQKTAERAAVLTRQLLAFSRKQAVAPRLLDLNGLLSNMDGMLRRLIGEDIEIATRLAPDIGRVKADPGQIEQVVMNLVVNARDAMPGGGTLTIETANVVLDEGYTALHRATHAGPHVMIAVTDTGSGMSEETKEHIFEPFFTTKENGTGLGLSTAYGIIKQSGGNIWVYSEPGIGTSFKIYFPRVVETGETTPAPEGQAISGGSETILLVEDEEAVREIVRETLAGQGYSIIEARHGPEALMLAEKYRKPIQLLVTDVVMPAMSGPELATSMTKSHPETKVLFMSGYTDNTIGRQGVMNESRNFLQKPFSQIDLASRVRALLDQ
jgi:two-component system cell cycle sensor histidine kinase/response regulator CckA